MHPSYGLYQSSNYIEFVIIVPSLYFGLTMVTSRLVLVLFVEATVYCTTQQYKILILILPIFEQKDTTDVFLPWPLTTCIDLLDTNHKQGHKYSSDLAMTALLEDEQCNTSLTSRTMSEACVCLFVCSFVRHCCLRSHRSLLYHNLLQFSSWLTYTKKVWPAF